MNSGAQASARRRRTFEEWLYDALGTEWGGNTNPPLDLYGFDVPMEGGTNPEDKYVFRLTNDAFEVYMGYPSEWRFHMNRRTARKFVWWYLKWHVFEWFGLRRWLWYKLLFRRVRNYGPPR